MTLILTHVDIWGDALNDIFVALIFKVTHQSLYMIVIYANSSVKFTLEFLNVVCVTKVRQYGLAIR